MCKAIKSIVNSNPSIHALRLAAYDLKMVLGYNEVKLLGDVLVKVIKNVVLGSVKKDVLCMNALRVFIFF